MIKKIGIIENYKFYTYKNNYNLININNLIKNILLNYNIYVSNIYMYEYPKSIIIKFDIWIYNKNIYKILTNIINLLKSLLILKYNKNIELNIKISKDIFNDDLLISNYIKKNYDKIKYIC